MDVPAPTTLAYVTFIALKISHSTIHTYRNTAESFNQSAPYYLTLYTERYPLHCQSYTLFKPLGFSWIARHLSFSAAYSIDELPSGRTVHTCRLNRNGFKQISLRYFLVLRSFVFLCLVGCCTCFSGAFFKIGLAGGIYAGAVPTKTFSVFKGKTNESIRSLLIVAAQTTCVKSRRYSCFLRRTLDHVVD